MNMKKIIINPYSVEGGFSKAYQIAQVADVEFDAGQAMGYCSIWCEEKDVDVICELLKEEGLKFEREFEFV
jgi:hypothetical protein